MLPISLKIGFALPQHMRIATLLSGRQELGDETNTAGQELNATMLEVKITCRITPDKKRSLGHVSRIMTTSGIGLRKLEGSKYHLPQKTRTQFPSFWTQEETAE